MPPPRTPETMSHHFLVASGKAIGKGIGRFHKRSARSEEACFIHVKSDRYAFQAFWWPAAGMCKAAVKPATVQGDAILANSSRIRSW